nr:MAG TPA: tail accessory factor [Caudoviricetes sp.]
MNVQVNEIIQDAFSRCTLVGDGMTVTGTQASVGLRELNSVLAELNTQDYISENVKTLDVTSKSDVIKFAADSEHVHVFAEYDVAYAATVAGKFEVGDLVYVTSRDIVYEVIYQDEQYGLKTTQLRQSAEWPDMFLKTIPDRVISVARKIGQIYTPLYQSNQTHLDTFVKQSLPTTYTCGQSVSLVAGKEVETFDIRLNSARPYTFKITYLDSFKKLTLDDELHLNPKTLDMITSGLCVKLATRYKFTDYITVFNQEFANIKRAVKTINKANRPLVYEYSYEDPMARYYDGFAPKEW